MTITELVERSYTQAKELGWADKEIPVPEMIALIHSEASEALESFRNNELVMWTDQQGKPQGIASEFADILIRIGHYSHILGIPLDAEIDRKLKYNMHRGYRHGGKAI
jgi:NTP pyrophosphatase (non-canonical NTP hydrolase)